MARRKRAQARRSAAPAPDALADRQTPALKRRLLASLVFLILLMYLSMGHTMWGWPLPGFWAGQSYRHGADRAAADDQQSWSSTSAFSSAASRASSRARRIWTRWWPWAQRRPLATARRCSVRHDRRTAAGAMPTPSCTDMHEFYFESAAMILTLITVGKMLEARSKGKTTDALQEPDAAGAEDGDGCAGRRRSRRSPLPRSSTGDDICRPPRRTYSGGRRRPGGRQRRRRIGPHRREHPGGQGARRPGQLPRLPTSSGFLRCRASRVGEDTTLAQIIQMVSDAAATKAPIAKVADKVSGVFVPAVIAIAAVTTVIWLLTGQTVGYALARGISVLVISCPCALGLATPVAIMVGNGVGAKHGILFKTAASLEAARGRRRSSPWIRQAPSPSARPG